MTGPLLNYDGVVVDFLTQEEITYELEIRGLLGNEDPSQQRESLRKAFNAESEGEKLVLHQGLASLDPRWEEVSCNRILRDILRRRNNASSARERQVLLARAKVLLMRIWRMGTIGEWASKTLNDMAIEVRDLVSGLQSASFFTLDSPDVFATPLSMATDIGGPKRSPINSFATPRSHFTTDSHSPWITPAQRYQSTPFTSQLRNESSSESVVNDVQTTDKVVQTVGPKAIPEKSLGLDPFKETQRQEVREGDKEHLEDETTCGKGGNAFTTESQQLMASEEEPKREIANRDKTYVTANTSDSRRENADKQEVKQFEFVEIRRESATTPNPRKSQTVTDNFKRGVTFNEETLREETMKLLSKFKPKDLKEILDVLYEYGTPETAESTAADDSRPEQPCENPDAKKSLEKREERGNSRGNEDRTVHVTLRAQGKETMKGSNQEESIQYANKRDQTREITTYDDWEKEWRKQTQTFKTDDEQITVEWRGNTRDSHNQSQKGLPVSKWQIEKFGGKEEDLPRFLTTVKQFALAECATKEEVFRGRVHLFKGDAADFVCTATEINNWDTLVMELTRYCLGSDSDVDLIRRISQKTQGAENCATFITRMELMFETIRNPFTLSERDKVEIVLRGLRPSVKRILAGTGIEKLSLLKNAAQRVERILEEKAETNANHWEQKQRLEQPNQWRNTNPPRDNRQNPNAKNDICYRCGKVGHMQRECNARTPIRCYGCGEPGVIKRDCRKCSGNGRRRPQ